MAATTVPGLAAVLDQHEAAVRDILTTGVEASAAVAGTVLLAGYARGIQDHLRERGLSLPIPTDATEWRTASWFHVRLLAVCSLARNMLPGHPVARTHDLPSLA